MSYISWRSWGFYGDMNCKLGHQNTAEVPAMFFLVEFHSSHCRYIYGGFHKWGYTIHHPFLDGIFPDKNHRFGGTSIDGNPHIHQKSNNYVLTSYSLTLRITLMETNLPGPLWHPLSGRVYVIGGNQEWDKRCFQIWTICVFPAILGTCLAMADMGYDIDWYWI